jgi:hypothetical protein
MTIDLDSDYGEVTIEYEYDPGEPDQWYDSNGDPGTPGYGPSVTIYNVWCLLKDEKGTEHSVDIFNIIDAESEFTSLILSYHEE